MPNRILKESICASENIDNLSMFQEIFFYRLLVNCDDYGRMDARTKILSSRLFPLRDISSADIEDAVKALVREDLVILYEVNGKLYLQAKTWNKHQQIRSKKSKYPSPNDENARQLNSDDIDLQAHDINCNQMISDDIKCPRNPIQSNIESNPNTNTNSGKTQKRFTPPTLEEVAAYCKERENGIDPEYFIAYNENRNWTLSNGKKMKDWKLAIVTWEKHNFNKATPVNSTVKKVVAQDYTQRDYVNEDEEAFNRMLQTLGS